MLGYIALTLSLSFSAYLIMRDVRGRRDVSWAVWIPTVLMLILASRPPSRWLEGRPVSLGIENANDLQSSMVDQVFFFLVLGSSLLVTLNRRVKWSSLFRNNLAIMVFYGYFALSVAWSSDPAGSAKRIIKDFGLLFAASVIFSEKHPLSAMRAVYLRSAFLLLPLSVVLIRYFPNLGRSYSVRGDMQFTGVTTQKNSLGETTLIFLIVIIWDYLESRPAGTRRRWWRIPLSIIPLFLTGAYLLRLSESKSALVCLATAVFLIMKGRRYSSRFLNRFILIFALSLPVLILFSEQFSDITTPLLHAIGRDATFTGRTEIWKNVTWDTVNPLIGAGYWNFWGGPGGLAFNESLHEVIPNAHNGYIDLYLDGGMIGIGLLYLLLIVCGWGISKRLNLSADALRYQRARFAFLIVAIIYNNSESTFARIGPMWFTTLLMLVDFSALAVSRRARNANQLASLRDYEAILVKQ